MCDTRIGPGESVATCQYCSSEFGDINDLYKHVKICPEKALGDEYTRLNSDYCTY